MTVINPKDKKCTDCTTVLNDENHYKSPKTICKKCYIKRIKQSENYTNKHTSRGFHALNQDKIDEIYQKIKSKEMRYSKAARAYDLNPATVRVWYVKEKERRGD